MPATFRGRWAALLLVTSFVFGGLAACGDVDSSSPDGEGTTDDSTADATDEGPDEGAFPVTVPSTLGEATIDEEPERVVALGWSDAEVALALGVQPVGAADWLEFGDAGVGPWAADLYEEDPELLPTDAWDYEAIVALDPDVILNTVADGEQESHDLLSQIAPTVGIPEGSTAWGTSWQDQVTQIATALGRQAQGEQLIAETEQLYAEAAAANPDFEGSTVTVGARFGDQYGAYVSQDARVAVMEGLGFENSPAVEELATGSFYIPVSAEEVDLFDADLTVMFPFTDDDLSGLQDDALLQGIPSAEDGRMLILDDPDLIKAFSAGSVLASRHLLEEGVPLFAAALAGDSPTAES